MKFPAPAVALPLCLAAAFPALAADDAFNSPFTLQIGAFDARASTSIRLDSDDGRLGTNVSFEGDLGGEKKKALPSFDFTWRINPRHALEGSWVSHHRDGDTTLTGQVNWGDLTFPVSANIHSTFDSDILRLAYRWSVIHDDSAELGLLLGVHYTKLSTSLASGTGSLSKEASVDYPLPTLGVRGRVRLAPNWQVAGFGQFLKLKVGDYDGEVYNFGGSVDWAFSRNLIAGLGYEYYKYNLVSSKGGARGEFDYRFQGPKLTLGWAF